MDDRGRSPDEAATLAALLRRLEADGEPGGLVYERLRLRLVAFLRLHARGEAESLADIALDRLARRVHEGVAVEHVPSYALGIARLLVREEQARRQRERRALEGLGHEARIAAQAAVATEHEGDMLAPGAGTLRGATAATTTGEPAPGDPAVDAEALAALLSCLEGLDAATRRFVLEYYVADGPARITVRQQLAAALGLYLNALRNRALRLRARLEDCVTAQLGRDADRVTDRGRGPLDATGRGNRDA